MLCRGDEILTRHDGSSVESVVSQFPAQQRAQSHQREAELIPPYLVFCIAIVTMVQSLSTRSIFSWGLLLSTAVAQQAALPQLNGQHFRISVLEEKGFLDVNEAVIGDETELYYSGYLIDMLEALARPSRANFTYTLLPPSGYGSLCNPQLEPNSTTDDAYNALYRTQYNCGASDVNDVPLLPTSTDMYLGMYYVTPSRQLTNHFTIPFLPPFSGTLAMFGTATGIADFDNLVEQQKQGLQPAACAPGGSALITEVANSFPGIQLKDLYGGEDVITAAFQDGTCEIYIFDGPLAASYVLRRQQEDECMANGKVSNKNRRESNLEPRTACRKRGI